MKTEKNINEMKEYKFVYIAILKKKTHVALRNKVI